MPYMRTPPGEGVAKAGGSKPKLSTTESGLGAIAVSSNSGGRKGHRPASDWQPLDLRHESLPIRSRPLHVLAYGPVNELGDEGTDDLENSFSSQERAREINLRERLSEKNPAMLSLIRASVQVNKPHS